MPSMNEVMESPTDSPTKKKGEKKLKRQSSEKVKKEKRKSSTDYLQRGEEEENKTREEKERERAERKKKKEEKRRKEEMKESGEKSSKKTEGENLEAEDEAKIEIETKKIEELKRRIEEKKREEEEDEKERKERLKFEALTKRNSRIINDVNDVVDDNFSEPEIMSEDEVLPESKKPIQNDVIKVVSFEVKKVDQPSSQKKQSITNSVSLTEDVTRGQEEIEPITKDTTKNTVKVEKPIEKDIASCPPLEEAKQKLKIYIPKEGSTQPPLPQVQAQAQAQTKSNSIAEKERPQYRPMSPLKPAPQVEELPDYFEVTPEMSQEEAEAVKRRLERAQRRTNRANSVGSINFPAPLLKDFSKTSASTSLSSMDSVTSPTNSLSTTPNPNPSYKRFSFSGPSSSHYTPENLAVTKSLNYNYHAPSTAQTGNYYRGPTSGCSAGPSSSYYSSTAKPPPGPAPLDSPQTAQLYGDIKERVSSWHHGYMKRERAKQKEEQENDELTRAIEKERNLGTGAQQQQPRKMSLFEEAEKQKKEKEQAQKMESEELEREQRMMARQQERLQRQMERIEKQGAERPLSELSQDSPDTFSPTSYKSSTSTPTTTPISSNKDEVSVTHTSLYTRDEINSPSKENSVFTSMYTRDEYVKRPLSTFRRTVPKV